MANVNFSPTESELEILHLLWEHGESSVRFINEKLNEKREVGYTTTLKTMQIMHEKDLVTRNTEARTHLYKAFAKEKSTKGNLLRNFIASAFNGSSQELMMQALGDYKASKEEIQELKDLISKLEKTNHG